MGDTESQVWANLLADPDFTDRYKILRSLGGGAAGYVFLLEDNTNPQRKIAFKFLACQAAFDDHTIERFIDELRVCQKISHPNLVQAYDLLRVARSIGYTMEYVEGQDLQYKFAAGQITHSEIDHIFVQVLSALEALHRHAIVHRDLKMENVLVAKDGTVKLSDLGLLKRLGDEKGLTRTGILLGTAQYMPPEYIKQSIYDHRGDLYALGIMLLELLVGKRWLADRNGMQAIEHLIKTKFEIPESLINQQPEKYQQILRRALEQNPKRRFQSAAEMRDAFLGIENSIKTTVRRVRKPSPALKGWGLAAAGMLGVVLAAAGIWLPREVAPRAGSYAGSVNLYGNTGYFKPAKLEVSAAKIQFQSELEGCRQATIDLTSLTGVCGSGRYKISLFPRSAQKIEGKIVDQKLSKVHFFSLTTLNRD